MLEPDEAARQIFRERFESACRDCFDRQETMLAAINEIFSEDTEMEEATVFSTLQQFYDSIENIETFDNLFQSDPPFNVNGKPIDLNPIKELLINLEYSEDRIAQMKPREAIEKAAAYAFALDSASAIARVGLIGDAPPPTFSSQPLGTDPLTIYEAGDKYRQQLTTISQLQTNLSGNHVAKDIVDENYNRSHPIAASAIESQEQHVPTSPTDNLEAHSPEPPINEEEVSTTQEQAQPSLQEVNDNLLMAQREFDALKQSQAPQNFNDVESKLQKAQQDFDSALLRLFTSGKTAEVLRNDLGYDDKLGRVIDPEKDALIINLVESTERLKKAGSLTPQQYNMFMKQVLFPIHPIRHCNQFVAAGTNQPMPRGLIETFKLFAKKELFPLEQKSIETSCRLFESNETMEPGPLVGAGMVAEQTHKALSTAQVNEPQRQAHEALEKLYSKIISQEYKLGLMGGTTTDVTKDDGTIEKKKLPKTLSKIIEKINEAKKGGATPDWAKLHKEVQGLLSEATSKSGTLSGKIRGRDQQTQAFYKTELDALRSTDSNQTLSSEVNQSRRR